MIRRVKDGAIIPRGVSFPEGLPENYHFYAYLRFPIVYAGYGKYKNYYTPRYGKRVLEGILRIHMKKLSICKGPLEMIGVSFWAVHTPYRKQRKEKKEWKLTLWQR